MSLFLRFFFPTLVLVFAACTRDALPEPTAANCEGEVPTYAADVEVIIENTCAYSGCHLGGAPGIYNSYEGLLNDLQDGSFRERVITLREDPNLGMPPDYSPADRPRNLTEAELLIISCWLEAGFPNE
ncbi:hypothetical protein QWY85_17780 [Neolewinella lacunae]|uniref:Cytochrome C Planctomycete-type domain-containing protein n=1 Tax=Neolewinella lacunae TaxID=1517758 RepID=A0A923T8M4_9BACT|nr:hypothetical protein [Neolewinella lacunae]MBC6995785.1 hypothetical protein [Neolewinella lacunae]MDN3636522.1 hypothetical protein [Neolewinella lacunae]